MHLLALATGLTAAALAAAAKLFASRLALIPNPHHHQLCPRNPDPVCGPDGNTYYNECSAKRVCQLDGSSPGACTSSPSRPRMG